MISKSSKPARVLTADTLKGNWGTILLPVLEDERIDFGRLADEIDLLIAAQLNGIYSNGTAGEFYNQTEQEFDLLQGILAEKCHQSGMPFQVGASHPSPLISLERIRRSVSLRPSAFQVILPEWVPSTMSEKLHFLCRVAEAAAGIPLVLYNPPHARDVLGPQEYRLLIREVPRLIGIKVGGGDRQWYRDMGACSTEIAIFVPGHLLATGIQYKVASGAYSNMACLSPRGSQRWWQQMQTDLSAALSVQERILAFFEECISPLKEKGYSNPALDKFLAAVGGWCPIGTRLRWPYKWISEDLVLPVRARARKYLPEFFDP